MRIFFFLAKLLLHFKCKDHIINKKQITYDQNDKFGNFDKVQSWVQSSPLLPSDLKSCDFENDTLIYKKFIKIHSNYCDISKQTE